MNAVQTMHQGLARQPADDTGWLALADCLEEQGAGERAELVRLQLWLRRRLDDPAWAGWEARLRELWAAGVEGCQPIWHGPLGMSFVLIPPGQFWMGAVDDETWHNADELPRHRVTLSRGFWLGVTAVTQEQWQAVVGSNPSGCPDLQHPVEQITWRDAGKFCRRMGKRLARRVRLPTEAEWEYACRAGTATPFCSGVGVEALRQVGWCSYDGDWDGAGGTRAVGEFRPNSWGLHDMHGNVWEWCSDWYADDSYEAGVVVDPVGEHGEQRSMRGGSWRGGPWFCRSAERWAMSPRVSEINVGLRVLVELEAKAEG
jgi:uncharacterized protein (TIGR02996 family)